MHPLEVRAESDGFRGITWGASFKSVDNMNYVRSNDANGIMYYNRSKDELRHGGAIVNKIEYGFLNDKFIDVAIEATGTANCKSLKDSSLEEFGLPTEELHGKLFKWQGDNVVRVYLEKPDGGSCVLRMGSTTTTPVSPPAKQ
jgi:hypothetical protein